jgi:L-malate glycosyltransferase
MCAARPLPAVAQGPRRMMIHGQTTIEDDGPSVLYVNHTAKMAGAEYSLLDLLKTRPAKVVGLACPKGPLGESARSLGVPITSLPELAGGLRVHPVHTPYQLGEIANSAVRVARASRSSGANLVHANSIRSSLVACAANALGAAPLIAHVRDCLPDTAVANLSRAIILGRAAGVIVNSAYTGRNFAAQAPSAEYHVVYNSVDSTRFSSDPATRTRRRRRLGLAEGDFVIGVVGQLTPHKRQDTAIRVAQQLVREGVQARLLVVGEAKFTSAAARHDNAGYEGELRRLAMQGPPGIVTFLGERLDMPEIYGCLDTILIPSDEEPFGRTIIEAMACRVVPIATLVGGPPELIHNGIDGFLADPRQLDPWLICTRALSDDPAARRRMGLAGRDRVATGFSLETHRRDVRGVYDLILRRQRRRRTRGSKLP